MKRAVTICFVAVVFCPVCIGQTVSSNASLVSLVESERAFARTSLEKGIRASFMMFFDDDAMVFRPHPVKYKEAMKNVPPPKDPLEAALNWKPLYADVSSSGDFGYTTGPSVWKDNGPAKRPTYYGFYFSVWKKRPSGDWKVVFDIGTELPGPYNGPNNFRSPAAEERKPSGEKLKPEEQRSGLMNAERTFLVAAQKGGALKAFGEFLEKETRIYRQKEQPIIGSDSVRAYFSTKPYLSTWEPMQCDVAKSGDLGYVYGSYTVKGSVAHATADETGHYIRMWKRGATNHWRIVAEVISPVPAEESKTKK